MKGHSEGHLNDSTDEFLVALYAGGDEQGLSQLVARYATPLHTFTMKIMKDAHAAEDLVQEVFIAIATGIETLDRPRYFRRWIYRITYFKTIKAMRRRQHDPSHLLSIDDIELVDPASLPRSFDRAKHMRELLDRLDPADRAILELRYVQKFTFREIAEMTDQRADTLRKEVSRLRRVLIDRLHALERGGE